MLFSTPVMAVEPITGAFGFKLGDVWDGEAIETLEEDTLSSHLFIPESPLDAFDAYWVEVTPVKGLIFRIVASKGGECKSQFEVLHNVLNKKYGTALIIPWESELEVEWVIEKDGRLFRAIELKCRVRGEWQEAWLHLTYTDHFIEDNRIDELAEQVDSSNL